jgi:peptidoglycan hydrolase CwlO-like protein
MNIGDVNYVLKELRSDVKSMFNNIDEKDQTIKTQQYHIHNLETSIEYMKRQIEQYKALVHEYKESIEMRSMYNEISDDSSEQ